MEEAQPVQDAPTKSPDPNPNPDPPQEKAPAGAIEPPQPPPPPPPPQSSPPPTAGEAPSPPPPPAPIPSETKKRPLDGDAHVQDRGGYFKMRAVIKDIRPQLLEVLRTVDFRSCKGADELRERMKLLMELYGQMTAEIDTITKCKTTPEGHSLACENGAGPDVRDQLPDLMPLNQPQPEINFRKPSDSKPFRSILPPERPERQLADDDKPFRSILPPDRPERQLADDGVNQGCIVGGSAFGWNFITFSGNDPIYYGRTKESFRATNVTS